MVSLRGACFPLFYHPSPYHTIIFVSLLRSSSTLSYTSTFVSSFLLRHLPSSGSTTESERTTCNERWPLCREKNHENIFNIISNGQSNSKVLSTTCTIIWFFSLFPWCRGHFATINRNSKLYIVRMWATCTHFFLWIVWTQKSGKTIWLK